MPSAPHTGFQSAVQNAEGLQSVDGEGGGLVSGGHATRAIQTAQLPREHVPPAMSMVLPSGHVTCSKMHCWLLTAHRDPDWGVDVGHAYGDGLGGGNTRTGEGGGGGGGGGGGSGALQLGNGEGVGSKSPPSESVGVGDGCSQAPGTERWQPIL